MGCRFAYKLIHESGLQAFYKGRDSKLDPVGEIASNEFDVFDDPEFQSRYTEDHEGRKRGTFLVSGLHCVACLWLLERLPKLSRDCLSSRVSFKNSYLTLEWGPNEQALSSIARRLAELGYRIQPLSPSLERKIEQKELIRLSVSAISALASMHIGLVLLGAHSTGMSEEAARKLGFITALFSLPAIFYGGMPFYRAAVSALRLRLLHPDILISLALIVGYGFGIASAFEGRIDSYFDSLAMIVALLLLGRWVTRRALKSYEPGLPWKAWTSLGHTTSAMSLTVGQKILVPSGEKIPVDLKLYSSEAFIDESVVTGESIPRRWVEGQTLLQGGVNVSREAFEGEVLARYFDSSLTKSLCKLQSPPSIVETSRLEKYFTGFILFLVTGILFFKGLGAIFEVVALLLVACPCALSLSRPLSLEVLQSSAQKKGMSVLHPDRLLNLKNISSIVFDKTGTLTLGRPKLVNQISFCSKDEETTALLMARSLSSSNLHPLSQCLALSLADQNVECLSKLEIQEIPGEGVRGKYLGDVYALRKSAQASDRLSVSLWRNDTEVLQFEFEDLIRPEAASVLRDLKARGFLLKLLSGDRESSVRLFLKPLGEVFDVVNSDCSPEQKASFVDERSLYIGDGYNDLAAMNCSGLSVAMTGSLRDSKACDVFLMQKDLRLIPWLIRAHRNCVRSIYLNLTISILYNLASIVLVLLGAIGPVICAIVMPLSSLTVIAIARLNGSSKQF